MYSYILAFIFLTKTSDIEKTTGAIVYIGVLAFWILLAAFTLYKNRNTSDKLYKVGVNATSIIGNLLEKKFSYYKKLNTKQKALFIRRVFTFIETKKWVAKDGIDLSLNKKILISASAVQLTFGLSTYLMPHFKIIEVHPDIYLNKYTGHKHKGEVDVRGKIVLSWKYFEKGYAISDDKINLGLHEMAHALDISSLTKNSEYLQLLFERFRTNYEDEYKQFLENKFKFLREYGKVNSKEFFAVLVETYFENPQELHKNMPKLYIDMCFLLNQDIIHNIFTNFIGAVEKISSKCTDNKLISKVDVIKKTSFNILNTFKLISVYIIIIGFLYSIGINNNTIIDSIIPILFVMFILNITYYYFMSNRITLTKNYIVLSNVFGKKQCIDLYNIIAIIYINGKLEIAFFNNSKYNKIKIRTTAKQSEIEDILLYLSKTQILVKFYVKKKHD